MTKTIVGISCLLAGSIYGAQDLVSAVHAAVTHVDAAGKTITVKTAEGSERTFQVLKRTTVHGAEATAGVAKDSWHGLEDGTDVVVHYTKRGSEQVAEEIDRIGKGGMKETKGTLATLDRAGRKMVVKSDRGVEESYDVSGNAARDAGKDIAKGSEDSAKVTVYYTEEGGKKVAHFFKKDI